MKKLKHPMQPIFIDKDGRARFKSNKIVLFLLEDGPNDMNRLARIPFDEEDRIQFAQLIGYSIEGFGELSYVDSKSYSDAQKQVDKLMKGK